MSLDTDSEDTLKHRLFDLLEAGDRRNPGARTVDVALSVLIVANVAAVAIDTIPEVAAGWHRELRLFEAVCVGIFVLEYLARMWVCTEHGPLHRLPAWKARLRFAGSATMLIDALALLPSLLVPVVGAELTALRVIRLVRILKLVRYSAGLVTLGRVMRAERRALTATLIVMLGLILGAAAVMYLIERHAQPDDFGSIPAAMWWALATLTTVGYGDVVPVTALGRIFGGMIAILGIAVYALPVAIVASGFMTELQRRDFVVSWGMVARVPLFARLDATAIARIATLLRAREVPRGYTIMRQGDDGDGLYVVVSGQVEILLDGTPARLGPGEFFGEIALLERTPRVATVIALGDCRLLLLESHEFYQVMDDYPELREAVEAVAKRRVAKADD
ncbi:MAG: cyclic nucleotide-gated ion channel [Alphaproteobacteria bacterium]